MYEIFWATIRHDMLKLIEKDHNVKDSADLRRIGVQHLSFYYTKIISQLDKVRAEIFNIRLAQPGH